MFNFPVFSVALILISSPVFGQVKQERKLCICPNDYRPLCASNGVTYPNQCQFTCAQDQQPSLSIFGEGPCPSNDEPLAEPAFEEEEPPKACLCSLEYRPVCGSDQITYGNPCQLSCAMESDNSLSLSSYGECKRPVLAVDPPKPASPKRSVPEPCFCTREFRPLCGSNGVTYANKCEFTCVQNTIQGLQIVSEGPCELQA